MTKAVSQSSEASFVPWRDDALLPEESAYSLVNKAAWFVSQQPVWFARSCNSLDGRPTKPSPARLDFADVRGLDRYFHNKRLMPSIHGLSFPAYLRAVQESELRENSLPWRSDRLRICASCIAMGVHLRLHQHTAVTHCPVHGVELESKCPHCQIHISYCSESNQGSYSCGQCHYSLLHERQITTLHGIEFRSAVASASSALKGWRMRALQDAKVGCGINRIEGGDTHPLRNLMANRVLLAARCRDSGAPAWIASCGFAGADVQVGSIRISGPRRDAAFRSISELDVAAVNRSFGASVSMRKNPTIPGVDDRISDARVQAALRRVTNCFLKRCCSRHAECLDTPFRMFGESLMGKDAPEELLQCCPVAVGFWLWRLSSTTDLRLITHLGFRCRGSTCANVDLLLYSLAKSHLHYLIYLASACAMLGRSSSGHQSSALDPVYSAMRQLDICWHPFMSGNDREREVALDGACHLVRFDCSPLIANMECAGSAPYVRRLRRQLRSTRVIDARHGREIELDLEHTWESKQFKQVRPFALMRHDRPLLAIEKWAELQSDCFEAVILDVVASRLSTSLKNVQWNVLDSAINSKSE